jgi:hypothetical protein
MSKISHADKAPTVYLFGEDSPETIPMTEDTNGIEWSISSTPIAEHYDVLNQENIYSSPNRELEYDVNHQSVEAVPFSVAPEVFTFVGFENLNKIEVPKKHSEENRIDLPKHDGFLPKWTMIAAKNMMRTMKKVCH